MCISTRFTWACELEALPNNKAKPSNANEICVLISVLPNLLGIMEPGLAESDILLWHTNAQVSRQADTLLPGGLLDQECEIEQVGLLQSLR
jgi:hypothetical protein